MASVVSRWSATPPTLSGSFSPGEWQNAGVLPMPGGFILVKNDSNFYTWLSISSMTQVIQLGSVIIFGSHLTTTETPRSHPGWM